MSEAHPKGIWPLLLVAAVLRLGITHGFADHVPAIWDEKDYDALAVNIALRGEFAYEAGQPHGHRPPLYPALVAGVYATCGVQNYQAVRYVQDVLSLGTLLLVYFIGRQLFGAPVGLWSAGIYAVYPSLLFYNNLLLSETLFTFLLALHVFAFARALHFQSFGLLAASGFILGLAALTRSVLWLYPAPLSLVILFCWQGGAWPRLAAAAVLLVVFATTLAPWSIRNTLREETFITVDTMGGRNFMMGNYEYTPLFRAWDIIAIEGEKSWHRVLRQKHPESVGITQGQLDKLAMKEAIRFVLSHPLLTLERDLVKFLAFWGLERELVAGAAQGHFGDWGKQATVPLALLVFGSYAVTMILAVFGLFMVRAQDWWLLAAIVLVVGFICALHTLSFGHSRYHLPLMPLLFPFSAAAWLNRTDIWKRRHEKAFWFGMLCSVFLVIGWIAEAILQDREWVARLFSMGS